VGAPLLVELDVFTGRRNPTWMLSTDEAAELCARTRRLTPGGGPAKEGGLGYRGFLVYRVDGSSPVLWMKVVPGTVRLDDGKEPRWHSDTAGIEQWLRGVAAARGHRSLITSG
jgi:hypothetical protein